MERNLLIVILRFVFLILFQVTILDHINLFGGLSVPFLYPAIILLLPVSVSQISIIFIGVLVGFSMDIFSNTVGLHTSAMVTLAYVRKYILQLIAPRDGYEKSQTPSLIELGRSWFISYIFISLAIHHFWIFNLENFQFSGFWSTQLRALLSLCLSFLLFFLFELLTYTSRQRRR